MEKQLFLEEMLRIIENEPLEGMGDDVRQQFIGLTKYLLQPVITAKDIGLTYSTIKYWEKKGYLLLQTDKQAEEWRRYTILEALWFEILKKAVDMRCTLEKTAPNIFFAYVNYTGLNCSFVWGNSVPVELIRVMEGIRVEPFLNFLKHVIGIVLGRVKSSLFLSKDGFMFSTEEMDGVIKPAEANKALLNQYKSGINICISDIVIALVLGNKKDIRKATMFSDEEMTVFKELANEDVKEIKIKKGKRGEIYGYETTKRKTIHHPAEIGRLVTNKHQNINAKVNDKFNHIEVEITDKHRL
jgi:hypothetical protein